jgi:hypothetical protein
MCTELSTILIQILTAKRQSRNTCSVISFGNHLIHFHSGGARIIREPGQNFIRKFTIQNTDTRFDKMYELIFSSEQESKVNIENWQKKPYFRSTKFENEFINVRKK